MKKILLIAIMAILSLTATAQEKYEFMGIPIKGTQQEFYKKLEAKGFTHDKQGGICKGKFAGKDVVIGVDVTAKSKQVYRVMVTFGEESSWDTYLSDFNHFKELLDKKYGKGNLIERYTPPYKKGGDYEMLALKLNKLVYAILYDKVRMMITYQFGIMIMYSNNDLEKVNKKEKEDISYNDL